MSRLTKISGVLVVISALLHLAIPVLTGFSAENNISLLNFFILSGTLGRLVLKNIRWAMWLSFFMMILAGFVGMAAYLGDAPLIHWLKLGIWGTSWMAAACLFVVLWRDKVQGVIAQNEQ